MDLLKRAKEDREFRKELIQKLGGFTKKIRPEILILIESFQKENDSTINVVGELKYSSYGLTGFRYFNIYVNRNPDTEEFLGVKEKRNTENFELVILNEFFIENPKFLESLFV